MKGRLMAHRHTVQKRARGGKALGPSYTDPGSSHISNEAKSQKEDFAHGGGVQLARAHGGKAKARGDRMARGGKKFEQGGSVWSHAASGLRGKKGFAGVPQDFENKPHSELMKSESGASEVKSDAKHRQSHKGKASHQYAKGGRTKFMKGGTTDGAVKDGKADSLDNEPEKEPEGEWESKHKHGGRTHKAKGGRLAKKHGGECDEED